jgi:hypothetical protein
MLPEQNRERQPGDAAARNEHAHSNNPAVPLRPI